MKIHTTSIFTICILLSVHQIAMEEDAGGNFIGGLTWYCFYDNDLGQKETNQNNHMHGRLF